MNVEFAIHEVPFSKFWSFGFWWKYNLSINQVRKKHLNEKINTKELNFITPKSENDNLSNFPYNF